MITTQRELRKAFWNDHPHFAEQARAAGILTAPQDEHCATVRYAFCDWLDYLQKSGQISERLADRATL